MTTNPALLTIAANLRTQDNRITDAPMFIVQEKRRVTGFDTNYCDDVVWIDCEGDYAEADSEKHKELEEAYETTGDEPANWIRTGYKDEWRFVTACFTEAGCQEYIDAMRHRHRGELRIYAESSYRNEEWRAVREHLMSLNEDTL